MVGPDRYTRLTASSIFDRDKAALGSRSSLRTSEGASTMIQCHSHMSADVPKQRE